jgi:hypothetical protein
LKQGKVEKRRKWNGGNRVKLVPLLLYYLFWNQNRIFKHNIMVCFLLNTDTAGSISPVMA